MKSAHFSLLLLTLCLILICSCSKDKKGLKSDESLIRFAAAGDIMLARGVRREIEARGIDWPFKNISSFFSGRDFVYVNLETALDRGCQPLSRKELFYVPAELLSGLGGSGINIFNLANDHSLDCGREAFIQMSDFLSASGFHTLGCGRNQEQASAPLYILHGGITLGLVSFTTFPVEGLDYCSSCSGPSFYDRDILISRLEEMNKRSDYRIVTFHWGSEYSLLPDEYQVKLAHEAVDFGADIVIGHGPHVLQSIEKVRGKWIIYSLGNLIYDQIFPGGQEGAILCAEFRPSRMMNLRLLPVKIQNGQPSFLRGQEASKVLDAIIERSPSDTAGQVKIIEDIIYLK